MWLFFSKKMYVNEIFDANIVKKTYLNYISLIECCIYCNPIRKNQYFSFHFPFIPTKTGNTKIRAMMEKSSPPHDPTAKENQKGSSCPSIRNSHCRHLCKCYRRHHSCFRHIWHYHFLHKLGAFPFLIKDKIRLP